MLRIAVVYVTMLGLGGLVGWAIDGLQGAAILAAVGVAVSALVQTLDEQHLEVARLRSRIRACEEGKAAASWVARIANDVEAQERLFGLDVDRLEERLDRLERA